MVAVLKGLKDGSLSWYAARLVVRENCSLCPLEVRPDLAEVVPVLLAQALGIYR